MESMESLESPLRRKALTAFRVLEGFFNVLESRP